jgi:excisionase family DNA binding protein
MEPMTREELATLPITTTIETAARALGLGRTRAYELARQGRFPCKVIRIGTSYRVVTADLRDLLAVHDRGGEVAP